MIFSCFYSGKISSGLKRRNSSYQKAKKLKINRKLPIIMILFQNFPTPISKFPRVAWGQRWIWQEKNPTLLLIFRNFPTPRVGFQSPTPRNPTRGVISTAGRIRLLETISNFLMRRNVNFGITTTSSKVDDEEWHKTSRNHCLSNYLQ